MKQTILPGTLAFGLIFTTTALAQTPAPAGDKPLTAVTPPLDVEAFTPPVSAVEAKPARAAQPAAEPAAPAAMDPKALKSNSSYALGFRTGATFAQQFGRFGINADDLDPEVFLKGFLAAFKGEDPGLDEETLQQAMQALGGLLEKREQDLATANLADGRKFLEENAKRAGVVTTASGLQYEVLTPGGSEKYSASPDGDEDDKQFFVHYKGTLTSGKEFDSSPEGQPVPMTLQVVPGFKEALTSMPVGAKWKIFLPSELAYGPERRSAEIGPNSVLIFELELVKIEDAPPSQGFPMPMPIPQE